VSTAARKARKRAGVQFEHTHREPTGPLPRYRSRMPRPMSGAQLQLVMELARALSPSRPRF
jgi:hypothetical protein